jgi:hypothetical protein
MAFDINSFKAITQYGQDTPDLFIYSSPDALSVIRTVGYFNDRSVNLKVNDIILVVSSTGGTPVHSFNVVNSNTGGVVDVTDGLVITATDTD